MHSSRSLLKKLSGTQGSAQASSTRNHGNHDFLPQAKQIQQRLNQGGNFRQAPSAQQRPHNPPAQHFEPQHFDQPHDNRQWPEQGHRMVPPAAMPGHAGMYNQAGMPNRAAMANQMPRTNRPAAPNDAELRNIKSSLNKLAATISEISQSQRNANQARASQDGLPQQLELILRSIGELNANFANFQQDFSSPAEIADLRKAIDRNYGHILSRIDQGMETAINPDAYAQVVESSHAEIIEQVKQIQAAMQPASHRTDQIAGAVESSYQDICHRIGELEGAISTLGNSQGGDEFAQISNQLLTLDQAVSALTRKEAERPAIDLSNIEMRLEEVNRAIVAMSSASQGMDNLERIEARLIDLSRELDTLSSVENAPVAPAIEMERLEDHFRETSSALREIESRLELHERTRNAEPELEGVSAELIKLGEKIDNISVISSGREGEQRSQDGESALLARLDELVDRVEQLRDPHEAVGGSQDTELLQSLQQQVVGISQQLENFAMPELSLDPITRSLGNIEQQLGASRDISIELAAGAAEEALRRVMPDLPTGETGDHHAALNALHDDLRTLQGSLDGAVQSDAHFLEMKDALGEIAARIGAVEANIVEMAEARSQPVSNNAAVDQMEPVMAFAESGGPRERRDVPPMDDRNTVSETINDMMDGPSGSTDQQHDHGPDDGMLDVPADDEHWEAVDRENQLPDIGGPEMAPEELPETGQQTYDFRNGDLAGADDTPLEPGAATPDLASLVRQANERNKAVTSRESVTGTDFLEAARKAAQAAAYEASTAEADDIDEEPEHKRSLKNSLQSILNKRKKPIILTLLAALMLSAAVPIAKNFMSDNGAAQLVQSDAVIDDGIEAANEIASAPEADAPEGDRISMVTEIDEPTSPTPAEPMETTVSELQDEPSLEQTNSVPAAASQTPFDLVKVSFASDALKIAAQQNDPIAIFEIGRRYTNGIGTEKNLEEAAEWYEHAAKLGYVPAQYIIGNFSEKGVGVPKDRTIAEAWYEQAAESGHVVAMHNLAVMNATPDPVSGEQDLAKAHKWFVKAAEHGVRDSQVNAGIFFAKGTAVPVDLVESYKWFAIAAKSGDSDAAQKRDFIADAMRPDQLEEARNLVDNWKQIEANPASNTVSIPDSWKTAEDRNTVLNDQNSITQAQLLLNNMGFDVGPADGVMGRKTREAIKNFRAKSGLAVNDTLDAEFMETLKAVSI